MVFNSLTFVLFFAAVLLVHNAGWISWRAKKLCLLVASYAFYAAWNPPFVLLLWISTVVDFVIAARLPNATSRLGRRALLGLSLAVNLGMLGFFKYADFAAETFAAVALSFGIEFQPAQLGIVLPVGISFYTFQSLSYTIDIYRGELRPWRSFLDFALFVTFFPQLVAGPIVRAADFLPQLSHPRKASADQLGWGCALIVFGLFEKTRFADRLLAGSADKAYENAQQCGFVDAWVGTLAFAGQIFFDFAGYTTCAIGCSLALGFVVIDNFRFPYAAIGFSDFWRRWHISLSTWLRDYVYIPLGGNRRGALRTQANLMATMLIGGLWHGASWRFVVWGGLHGTYLIAERHASAAFGDAAIWRTRSARVALALLTFGLVCLTWVFFRASSFADALHMIEVMLTGGPDRHVLGTGSRAIVLVLTFALVLVHGLMRNSSLEDAWRRVPVWARPLVLAGALLVLCLNSGDERAFIYFQF